MKPRTVIVDDHTLLAEAFKKLAEGEYELWKRRRAALERKVHRACPS